VCATQAVLSERIGKFIDDHYTGKIAQYVHELAHYYGRNSKTDKQSIYLRLVADVAKESNANQAAIDYYQRLLPLFLKVNKPMCVELDDSGNLSASRSSTACNLGSNLQRLAE
jgi:hypothetical protein